MLESPKRLLRIDISHEKGDVVRISIADTGKGISKADLPRVFNPFFTTKGEMGTGLGLYIAKRVVEEHNGTINVKSDAEGTTFSMNFPRSYHAG
jgi:signal transduction histidine kinase